MVTNAELDCFLQYLYQEYDWVTTQKYQSDKNIDIPEDDLVHLISKLFNANYVRRQLLSDGSFNVCITDLGSEFILEGGYLKKEAEEAEKKQYEYEKYFLEVEALRGQISKFRFDRKTTWASIIISIASFILAIIALCISA